eukprot:403356580
MIKSICILSVLCVAAVSANSIAQEQSKPSMQPFLESKQITQLQDLNAESWLNDNSTIAWTVQAIRGSYIGYEKGFYPHISDRDICLNERIGQKMYNVVQFLQTFNMEYIFTLTQDVTDIWRNLNDCDIGHPFKAAFDWCNADYDNCSFSTIKKNFHYYLFQIFSKATEIEKLVNTPEFPAKTASGIYRQTYTLGNDFGLLLKWLLNFKNIKQ